MVTEMRRCPKCREMTMHHVDAEPSTSLTPPLADLADYEVYECANCPADDGTDAHYRVEAKRDGTPTEDTRYTTPLAEMQ